MPHAEILEAEGTQHLVVTHKSILRALLCVALNLPSTSFRAFDIHNAGVCTFRCARLLLCLQGYLAMTACRGGLWLTCSASPAKIAMLTTS